jgi:hypothetical protein
MEPGGVCAAGMPRHAEAQAIAEGKVEPGGVCAAGMPRMSAAGGTTLPDAVSASVEAHAIAEGKAGQDAAAGMPSVATEGTTVSLRIAPYKREPRTVLAGVISINGGVGVGKSTVLDMFKTRGAYVSASFRGRTVYLIEEPVTPQVSHRGYDWSTLLKKMYDASAARREAVAGARYSFAAVFQL